MEDDKDTDVSLKGGDILEVGREDNTSNSIYSTGTQNDDTKINLIA